MKVISLSLLAIASAVSISGAAHAQTFDGPSVGVQGGWAQNKLLDPETAIGVTPIDASKDTATFGGFVGYDKTIGKFVLGAEAGLSVGTSDAVIGSPFGTTVSVDPKWSFDLTARAGYLVTPKTLVYARGGYVNNRIRSSVLAQNVTTVASENRDGWLVGAGVEREIIPDVSARIEYRYSDLSEGDGEFDRHQSLFGITYRF